MHQHSPPRILRIPTTEERTGLSRASLYRLERLGKFPKRVKIGTGQGGSVGWLESDVSDWIEARAAGRDWCPEPSTPEAA